MKKLAKKVRKAIEKSKFYSRKSKRYKAKRVTYRTHFTQVKRDKFKAAVTMEKAERALAEAQSGSANKAKIAKLTRELAVASLAYDEAASRASIAEKQYRRADRTAKRATAKAKWWMKRKTVLRRKLKAAKRKAIPSYEPWMANGYNDQVTPAVKAFVARGVVKYDLYVTSMRRTHVPPGGSSTSYHMAYPGKAADLAGAKMAQFQLSEWERNKGKSTCLELFGPDNNACLKHGVSMSMPEGSALETLHDSHVHGAFS